MSIWSIISIKDIGREKYKLSKPELVDNIAVNADHK